MIDKLKIVEENMPEILKKSEWHTLDVDYHPPHVQRLWTKWDGIRIMLHRFPEVCDAESALYHPHPWPSAMRVIKGDYIQDVGHEEYKDGVPYPVTDAIIHMTEGSSYEMTNPKAWHRVVPQKETYTLMITGALFDESEMSLGNKKPTKELSELDDYTRDKIMLEFLKYYD